MRERIFAMLAGDGGSVSIKATKKAQAALIGSDPEIFSIPACVGVHGWVGVDLRRVDREELRELVTEAWLMTSPERLTRDFDG